MKQWTLEYDPDHRPTTATQPDPYLAMADEFNEPGMTLSPDTLEATQRLAGLRAVYDAATCPHIRSSDEGTSYCALAEQSANFKPTPNFPQIRSSDSAGRLVEVE
jgi:hypothetical protein